MVEHALNRKSLSTRSTEKAKGKRNQGRWYHVLITRLTIVGRIVVVRTVHQIHANFDNISIVAMFAIDGTVGIDHIRPLDGRMLWRHERHNTVPSR
jgi:hypothetical protein